MDRSISKIAFETRSQQIHRTLRRLWVAWSAERSLPLSEDELKMLALQISDKYWGDEIRLQYKVPETLSRATFIVLVELVIPKRLPDRKLWMDAVIKGTEDIGLDQRPYHIYDK